MPNEHRKPRQMSAAATAAGGPADAAPKKSKLKLVLIAVVVLALAGGGAGWFFLSKKAKADGEHEPAPTAVKTPPAFLPLEAMVVNLADAGGDRMVQIGITVQLIDAKAAEQVKAYMPSIRSNILLLVSQRTSQELLQREGKEKLAAAIAREIAIPLGIHPDDEEEEPKPKASAKAKAKKAAPKPVNPVQEVLFSSFIIQ